jgi:hypothetical protein
MAAGPAATSASTFVVCTLLAGCIGAPATPAIVSPGPAPARADIAPGSKAKVVGIWANVGNVIFGQNSKGNKTVAVINAGENGCASPFGMKVDHDRNLWIACASVETGNGGVQKYSPGTDTPAATYGESIDCGKGCTFVANAFDVAFDSDGHVFAGNSGAQACTSSCQNEYPAVWWNESAPSSPPTGINDPSMSNGDYVDVDNRGNLYLSGLGCVRSACGILVDEIADPTSPSPTISHLILVTTGVIDAYPLYISNGGKVMNLTYSTTRKIAQYALPWKASESPFRTLGPTRTNYYGYGYPLEGGFNRGDSRFAIGDVYGWIDVGDVKSNHWSITGNLQFAPQCLGCGVRALRQVAHSLSGIRSSGGCRRK